MTNAAVAPDKGAALERYEAVIGIEIHCQLKTASKMFCGCSTEIDGAAPNSHCCPVCLGLPGVLPTINKSAVEWVLATGFAIDGDLATTTRWDRKNYFYPDLPKGYQISQYQLPLVANGKLTFDTSEGPFTVLVRRAHLEEDTGRLIHSDEGTRRISSIDYNRSGMPLMEIVTEPNIRTAEQARRYAEELRLLMRTIGASDAEMENGQMRVEANVSIRPRGREAFGTRVEVKNMNSMKAVERAISFEIERQAVLIDGGGAVQMETRGWDEPSQSTYHMRLKEEENDYRYFPEPDLPPLVTTPEWLAEIKTRLPELPAARRTRFQESFHIPGHTAALIVQDSRSAAAFEAAATTHGVSPSTAANWVTGEYLRILKESGATDGLVDLIDRFQFAELLRRIDAGDISGTNAKTVLADHARSGDTIDDIIARHGFRQISDAGALGAAIDTVLAANPTAVADYRAGTTAVIGFLVGQVMKATRGQANAAMVQTALRERLDKAE